MQPVTVTQFQDHIFNGRWDAALALLPRLTYDPTVALQACSLYHCYSVSVQACPYLLGQMRHAVLHLQQGNAVLAAGSLPNHTAEVRRGCGSRPDESRAAHPEKGTDAPENQ